MANRICDILRKIINVAVAIFQQTKYGITSAKYQGSTEDDANRRGIYNLGYDNGWVQGTNRVRFWEFGLGNMLWPLIWLWNR